MNQAGGEVDTTNALNLSESEEEEEPELEDVIEDFAIRAASVSHHSLMARPIH